MRIMDLVKWLVFVFLWISLTGCPRVVKLEVVNNFGTPLELEQDSRLFRIKNKGSVKLGKLVPRNLNLTLTIKRGVDKCAVLYELPYPLSDYFLLPDFDGWVIAQIENDFGIYLIKPSSDTPIEISSQMKIQESGHPIYPIQNACVSDNI